MGKSTIQGIGINDADYPVTKREFIDNKFKTVWICPFYSRWTTMIGRCYGNWSTKNRPNYESCYVCEEWLRFSNFKAWMEQQDWEGKQLDKDLIKAGNKCYSAEYCLFIDSKINTFIQSEKRKKSKLLVGVSISKSGKYYAKCKDLEGKNLNIGIFTTELEAHLEYRKKKAELANILADSIQDWRVSDALRKTFRNQEGVKDGRI